jgi:hypothetical protein
VWTAFGNDDAGRVSVDTLNAVLGRQLWMQYIARDVFFLTQQMRQREDPAFLALLRRLRAGECTHGDHDVLLTRSVGSQPRPAVENHLATAELLPVCITPRNNIRVPINFHAARAAALESGTRLLLCIAEDKCPRKPLTREQRLQMLDLDDNETNGQPGYLPLVEGMRYLLRGNTGTDVGLVNGAEVTLYGVILDPAEPEIDRRPGLTPRMLRHQPAYLLVTVDNPCFAPFPGLPAGVVPIRTTTQSYQRLGKDLGRKPQKGLPSLSIGRTQFKLVLAASVTVYNAQGSSKKKAILDLWGGASDIYVMLSRLTSLGGLTILRWFPLSTLQQRRSDAMLAEVHRLQQLAQQRSGNAPAFVPRSAKAGDTRCGCALCTGDGVARAGRKRKRAR